jgi:heat shock protein HslJ
MTEAGPRGPSATSDALAGTEWAIVRVDGQELDGGGVPLRLAFGHDGRVWGSTGVNELTASYSLTESYITFGPLATTRRSGSPGLMEQEQRLVSSFAGMCPFHLGARTLSIDGPFGRVELVSTAAATGEPAPPAPAASAEQPPPDA